MRKLKIITYFINSILLIVVATTSIFAWYTNTQRRGKIDANTAGLAFNYLFDNDIATTNSDTYTIDDLVFFDKDNTREGKYFSSMVKIIPISISNESDCDVEYSVSLIPTIYTQAKYDKLAYNATFDNTETYYTKTIGSYIFTEASVTSTNFQELRKSLYTLDDTENTYASRAYVDGFFSLSDEIEISSGSIASYISANNLSSTFAYSGLGENDFIIEAGDVVTFYLYLFGTQEIDTATNEMFINHSYDFIIQMTSTPHNVEPEATESE